MAGLFVIVLNMSIGASVCILAVMFLRLILHRAPKIFSYLLWAVVLVRLICPVLPKAHFGILPEVELYQEVPPMHKEASYSVYLMGKAGQYSLEIIGGKWQKDRDNKTAGNLEENSEHETLDTVSLPVENILADNVSARGYGSAVTAMAMVWGLAAFGLMVYASVGYVLFIRRIKEGKVSMAFVAGLIHPRIYLPEGLDDDQRQLVREHEKIHIRRLDYLVKPFAYLVCCLHWFNPLVWTAFFLMERDMEASCDEAVIRKIGYDRRKEYANVLLGLSQSRRWRAGYPIAFGENHVKDRIKGVVKMKKARLGVVTLAVGIILAAAVLLLVNRPGETPAADGEVTANPSQEQSETARLRDEASDDQETQPTVEEESSGIPDLRMREYYSAEELLEDDGSNYLPHEEGDEAGEGGQETIMNYDPNRARDQYEAILLPQTDDAFDGVGILFCYPVEGARVSDGFGSRIHPVSGDIMYHLGVDFAAEEGAPVVAAADGTVAKTGFDADCGNYVVILHENGDATYYGQCKEILVKEGEKAARGGQIATVGSAGDSAGAYLHFAVSRGGKFVEPEFEGE